MYKVMIVDDEERIVKGLTQIVDWHALGFEVTNTANSGDEALNLFKTYNHDLILTDIRMPELSGIELIGHIRKDSIFARIIIISGFNDFTYAKQAIDYNVSGYLLKPISRDELTQHLTDIRASLDNALKQERFQKQSNEVSKSRHLLYAANGFESLIPLSDIATLYSIDTINKVCRIVTMKIGNIKHLERSSNNDAALIRFAVKNIAEFILGNDNIDCHFFDNTMGCVNALICGDSSVMTPSKLKTAMQYVQFNFSKFYAMPIVIAISDTSSTINAMHTQYKETLAILDNKIISDNQYVYCNADLTPVSAKKRLWQADTLVHAIKSLELTTMDNALNELKQFLISHKVSCREANKLFQSILLDLGTIQRNLTALDGHHLLHLDITHTEERFYDLDSLITSLANLCQIVYRQIEANKKKVQNSIVDDFIQYIHAHYHEKINLKTISESFYMNPTYLGRLFKKSTGKTFNDYLNELRIKKVKEALTHTNDNLSNILIASGYPNPEYFYKVFQKYEGISFTKYREQKN